MPTTITLPDGYNGDTVECDATPIAEDGNMVKLRVTGSSYLFTWVRRGEWESLTNGGSEPTTTCQHPPRRLFSWHAGNVLCICCNDCGSVLNGGVE